MKKYDGWVIKNKWGSLLFWTFAPTRKELIAKCKLWKTWKKLDCKLVKVKLVEIEK